MDYPIALPLKVLEQQHPEYSAIAPTLRKIDDLTAGGHQIESRKGAYLKKRPGEESDLYALRLEKFTYTNVLGAAIAQQSSKLASGILNVSGLDAADWWAAWREHNDGGDRSEKRLIADLFRLGLKYQRVFCHAEKPRTSVQPRSRAEEEQLGLNAYLCLYSALEVIDWGKPSTAYEWIKVRQLCPESSPFATAKLRATWTFIDGEAIAKYSAYVKLGKDGAIAAIFSEAGEEIPTDETTAIELTDLVSHGAGRLPVSVLEIPDDLWLTNQAYLLALEHLNLENSRYDAAMLTYIQRTWRPVQSPDGDLDNTFVDSEALKTGNQYVLKADGFSFNEAKGDAIATVGALLQEIRDTIQDLIGLARASATKGAITQSGVSKKMDFVIQQTMLVAFGALVCDAYQDSLQLVSRMMGYSNTEAISVTGLDSFDLDSLDAMLTIATEIQAIAPCLPPTALRLFYRQLASLLARNASAEQSAAMDAEIEKLIGGADATTTNE